jgi:type VI secretion system secreted protein VgrG
MRVLRVCLLVIPFFVLTTYNAYASACPDPILGSACSFAVLGASAVTNTGNTVLYGDLGIYPGTSITGFPPGIVNGTIYNDDAVAMQAQADALTAYNYLQGLASNQNLTGQNLGGLVLPPGVYTFNSSAQLTGDLTINWGGLSNQTVVFQIGSTLTTASASMVLGTNVGQNDVIYWAVGSSATLGTTTSFQGNIIAYTSDTLDTGATDSCGRVIALNGAVTLDDNTINNCNVQGTVPEPGTIALVTTGAAVAVGANSSTFSFLGMGGLIAAFFRKRMR